MTSNSRLPSFARLVRAAPSVRVAARGAAFWIGALVPLAYVPLLALMDAGRVDGTAPLTTLIVVNAVALLIGYEHEPRR